MMKKLLLSIYKPFAIGILSITVLVASCSNSPVISDYDPSRDFTSLKNFYLFPYRQSTQLDAAVTEMELNRTEKALTEVFSRRFTQSAYKESDFVLSYYVQVDARSVYRSQGNLSRLNRSLHWDDRYAEKRIAIGNLVVDIHDSKTGKMLWRGSVVTGLGSGNKSQQSPEQRMQKLIAAVEKLLAAVPGVARNNSQLSKKAIRL